MHITLRPVTADDEPFLFAVYAGTRRDEIMAWGWSAQQQDAFLRMQFNAQHQSYRMQYPSAAHQLILLNDESVGRLIVVRSKSDILLADIALLPEYRNRGIGSKLIRELLDEAAGKGLPVVLQVLKTNPAVNLYERLGFVKTGESELHFQMRRQSA